MTAPDACPDCGREPEPDGRFCAGCGMGLGTPDRADGPAARAELISTTARTSPGSRHGWSMSLVAFALVGLLAWQIYQPPTQPMKEVASPLTTIDASVPPGWYDRPVNVPLIDIDVDLSAGATGDDAVAESAGAVSAEDLPTIGLGDVVGLDDFYMLISNYTHTVRLDAASEAVDPSKPGGLVVGHHRDQLILVDSAGGIRLAPIVNPETGQTVLRDGEQKQIAELRFPGDGRITVVTWDPPSVDGTAEVLEAVTFYLDSGEPVQDPPAAPSIAGWKGLGYAAGYGTYEIDPDGHHRWLSDGMPVQVGERNVLLTRCDEPGDCEGFWLSRSSGERVDRQVPPEDLERYSYDIFGPEDRFLTLRAQRGRLYFDTVTGVFLAGGSNPLGAASFQLTAEVVSPDGRYLLAPVAEGVVVHDLVTGSSGVLPVDIPGSPRTVLLIPKGIDGR